MVSESVFCILGKKKQKKQKRKKVDRDKIGIKGKEIVKLQDLSVVSESLFRILGKKTKQR